MDIMILKVLFSKYLAKLFAKPDVQVGTVGFCFTAVHISQKVTVFFNHSPKYVYSKCCVECRGVRAPP